MSTLSLCSEVKAFIAASNSTKVLLLSVARRVKTPLKAWMDWQTGVKNSMQKAVDLLSGELLSRLAMVVLHS